MSFIYSMIAKENGDILADFSEFEGSFSAIGKKLLSRIEKNKRGTISYSTE